MAALVALIVVWATLERKRWGRLALQGLSATTLGMFIAALGYVARISGPWTGQVVSDLASYVQGALGIYSSDTAMGYTIVVLACISSLWLSRPAIIAEFERGKKRDLAAAQGLIAIALVGCWGAIVISNPVAPDERMEVKGNHRFLPSSSYVISRSKPTAPVSKANPRKSPRRAPERAISL